MKKVFYFVLIMLFIAFPVKAAKIVNLANTDQICEAVKSNSRLTIHVYDEVEKKAYRMESPTSGCTNTTIFNKNKAKIENGTMPFVGFARTAASTKIYVDNVLVKNVNEYGEYSYLFISNAAREGKGTRLKSLYPRQKIFLRLDTKDKSLKTNTYKDLRMTVKYSASSSDISIAVLNTMNFYVYTNKKTYGPYGIEDGNYVNYYVEERESGARVKYYIYNVISSNLTKNIPSGETITGIKIVPFENFDTHTGYFRVFGMSLDGYSAYSNGKKYASVSNAEDKIRHNIVNNLTEAATIKWTIDTSSPKFVFYDHFNSYKITFNPDNKYTYYGIQYVNDIDTTIKAFITQAPKVNGIYTYKFSNTYLADAETSCNASTKTCTTQKVTKNSKIKGTLYVREKNDSRDNSAKYYPERKSDLDSYPFVPNGPGYIFGLDCSSFAFLAISRELPYLTTLAASGRYYNNNQVEVLGGISISAGKVETYLRKKKLLKDNKSIDSATMKSYFAAYVRDTYGAEKVYNGYGQLIPGDTVVTMAHTRMEVGYPIVICKDGTKFGGDLKTKYSNNACKSHGGIDPEKSYVIVTESGGRHSYRSDQYKPVYSNGKIVEYKYAEKNAYALPQNDKNWKVTLNKNLTDLKSLDDTYNKKILSIHNINRKYTFETLYKGDKQDLYLPFRYKEMKRVMSTGKVEVPSARLVLDKDYKNVNQEVYNYMASAKKLKGIIFTNYLIDTVKIEINGTNYYIYPNQTNNFSLYEDIKDSKILTAIKNVNYKSTNKIKVSVLIGPNVAESGAKARYVTVLDTTGLKPETIVKTTAIKLDTASVKIGVGKSITLKATLTPSNAKDQNINWKSSDESIVTVSAGKITGKKVGTATITATTNDTGKKATVKVTVVKLVTGVSLSKSSTKININKTETIKATIAPSNATNKKVTWTSSDKSVATVTATGTIKAIKAGTATITAVTEDGNKKATCKVTVVVPTVAVTGISLNSKTLTIKESETGKLVATVSPSNATDKKVTWTSSNTSIATVSNGVVTGKKVGTATITAKSSNGKTATATITVKSSVVAPTSVKLNVTEKTINTDESFALKATVSPSDATDKTVTWKSSDSTIASVANGVVTGKKAGTATITAKTNNGKTAKCVVTVKKVTPPTVAVTKVTLSPTSKAINAGSSVTLTATVSPSNATNKNIVWTSSDATIASVANGIVTGKKGGKVTITASSNNGKTATATITVNVQATGVTLSSASEEIVVGASTTLVALVSPSNATNKNIVWTSSDATIATIVDGVVTGKKAGTATITAKTSNGKTATATIKVKNKVVAVTGVTLSPTSKEIEVGKTVTLAATVSPSNATNKEVIWTSSDTSIATVDAAGKVTGIKAGTATITATTIVGDKQATSKITVKEVAVTEVNVDVTSVELETGETDTLEVTVSPSNATNKDITWTSSNEKIATVDTNGKITAKKAGVVTITAKSSNGKTATINVKVAEPPEPEPEPELEENPPDDYTEPLSSVDNPDDPTSPDDSVEPEKETNEKGKDNTLLIVGLSAVGVLGVGAGAYAISKRKKEEPVQENTNYQDNNYQNYSQDNMNNQNTDNNIDNSNNQNGL